MRLRSLPLLVLALVLAVASLTDAQPKDTLTIALPSHAPTLDPHMHFERVGVLVNINMFDSLLHRSPKLEYEPGLATSCGEVAPSRTTRTIWLMPARPAEPGLRGAFWSMVKV